MPSAVRSQHFPPPPHVSLSLEANGSSLTLIGAPFGANVTVDVSKLHLQARPHEGSVTKERSLRGSLGQVHVYQLAQASSIQNFSIPVTVPGPPGPPGIYDVWASASRGFATAPGGSDVPISDNTAFAREYPMQLSWPDESGDDLALTVLRKKFVGHVIYGYGGMWISCPPQWSKLYSASTPIRVRSIQRERGRITFLATGSDASASYISGLAFVAFDPLYIVVDRPPATASPLEMNRVIQGPAGDCPAIELADWQFDTTFSLDPPPTSTPGGLLPPLRVGMSRADVIWARGYPNEVGTRAALRAEDVWHYGRSPMDSYQILFRDDRVSSFTTPRGP